MTSYDQTMMNKYKDTIKDRVLFIRDDKKLKSLAFTDQFDICTLSLNNCSNVIPTLNSKTIKQLELNCCSSKNIDGFQLNNLEVLKLNQNGSNVTFSNMQQFNHLKELSIAYSKINDLSNISQLESLLKLNVFGCNIKTLNISKTLKTLQELFLQACQSVDISSIQHLIKLTKLYMPENNIKDISAVSGLVNLKELKVSQNKIVNILCLQNLIQLTSLDLSNNNIKNIQIIQNLVNLEYLNLSWNKCVDISPIAQLYKLTFLDLCYNTINNLTHLSKLINLEYLDVSYNKNLDITPTQYLTNLQKLFVCACGIYEISMLRPLLNLRMLFINDNYIVHLQPIQHYTKLRSISADNNMIFDFSEIDKRQLISATSGQMYPTQQQLILANKMQTIDTTITNLRSLRKPNNCQVFIQTGKQQIFDFLKTLQFRQLLFTQNIVQLFAKLNSDID
ncbi:Conserved_hypothetical protein [Hexamita inflata]|uniref:Uncharacterized protein n=1 Tax=Hexamita inflata TaxID=28002 RepID=A0ABP1GS31_9EUKA